MNLETFKARARRKLALPGRNTASSAASDENDAAAPDDAPVSATQYQANTMNTPKASALSSSATPAGADRFAAALDIASQSSAAKEDGAPLASDPRSSNFSQQDSRVMAGQPLAGSPAPTQMSSDAQLAHLRALLLGNQQESQQDQVDTVYRRTQSGLNSLRRDMDARLTDLSEYVEQLEQSLLNSMDNQHSNLSDDSADALARHEQRLDALDTRLDDVLETARIDMANQRRKDQEQLEAKLANVTDRHDKMLNAISDRLDRSIAEMESSINTQLKNHTGSALTGSEHTITDLREQLNGLVDDRVRTLNSDQDANLTQLRETVLMHTQSIKAELKTQTEQQSTQLASHRDEMETQFNRAIMSLNDNKVSHKQLSQLLTRLADRVKQL